MTENKRFKEIVSTQKIVDNNTGKVHDGLIDDELLDAINELSEENEHYKSIFFELVENALTDKNCRKLYCKGILGIFDKANSLNQARDMIKEHLKLDMMG